MLCRFIKKGWLTTDGQAKSAAFLPYIPNGKTAAELSMFNTTGMLPASIWKIAVRLQSRPIARAELSETAIQQERLTLDPIKSEPGQHVNILYWPTEREDKLERALNLASKAKVFQTPD